MEAPFSKPPPWENKKPRFSKPPFVKPPFSKPLREASFAKFPFARNKKLDFQRSQIMLKTFKKLVFTFKEPFLCNVFALNFISWLVSFFLICRRARRQRSQSPVLGTSRIDKHFELYNELKTKRKTKEFPISLSSDEAKEQIPFDSPIGRKERGKLYNPATQFGHHARL